MTYILRDKDKNIITYGETSFFTHLEPGQDMEYIDQPIAEYARRLVLSHGGLSCYAVQAQQGGPDVVVDVSTTLGVSVIELDINGTAEVVELEETWISSGKGKLLLSTANPGIFIITPADRKTFCAAGCGTLVVEVVANA